MDDVHLNTCLLLDKRGNKIAEWVVQNKPLRLRMANPLPLPKLNNLFTVFEERTFHYDYRQTYWTQMMWGPDILVYLEEE